MITITLPRWFALVALTWSIITSYHDARLGVLTIYNTITGESYDPENR